MSRRLFLSALLTIALAAAPAAAQPGESFLRSNPQLMAAVQSVAEKPAQSTVRILIGDKEVALGTIVGADGWILTKQSELRGDPSVKLNDDRTLPAKIVGAHPMYDLALLKIDATDLTAADWRESKEAGIGAWVISPGAGKDAIAVGVLSVATRTGLSGPKFSPNPNGGYMGVRMAPGAGGVKIEAVEKDTPAEKGGLKVNDIITAIDDEPVLDNEDMLGLLGRKKPGEVISVSILRDGMSQTLKITLGKRPAGFNRGDFQNRMGSELSERRSGFPAILQHDTVLKPNQCGGPLVDLDGRVIGVNIARAGRTESYAIPAEVIRSLLPDLQSGKLAPVVKTTPAAPSVEAQIKELEEKLKTLREERASRTKEIDEQIKEAEELLNKLKGAAPKK